MRLASIAVAMLSGVLSGAGACLRAGTGERAVLSQGKTIRIVISTGVAGGYAEYARVIAEHMGRHIAGNPHFIVQSMPGAGGLLAANYLYTQAPQDGTTIGIVHSSVPLTPLWGNKGVRFDTLKFNWLGSLDRVDGMCISWHASPIKTWADMLTQGIHGRLLGRGLADGDLSGDPQQAVRHQDQGDRRLQGRHRRSTSPWSAASSTAAAAASSR